MRSSRNWRLGVGGGRNLIQGPVFHSETAHLHFFPCFPRWRPPAPARKGPRNAPSQWPLRAEELRPKLCKFNERDSYSHGKGGQRPLKTFLYGSRRFITFFFKEKC